MPVCTFFLEGRCGAEDCPYSHVQVSPDAPACASFQAGYCPHGARCGLRHTLTCPAAAAGRPCAARARCRLHHPGERGRGRAAADREGRRESLLLPAFARAEEEGE